MRAAGTGRDHKGGEWGDYWRDARNLRWGAVDREILETVALAMGWGPYRSVVELGGGRGWHSRELWLQCRCGKPVVLDPSREAQLLANRAGVCGTDTIKGDGLYDIVWSCGLVEHFSGWSRDEIVWEHFKHAGEMVVIVVPVASLQRKLSPARQGTPWSKLYGRGELEQRMRDAMSGVWCGNGTVEVKRFAPLYGVRHVPDALYGVLSTLSAPLLGGSLEIGVARRQKMAPIWELKEKADDGREGEGEGSDDQGN